MTPFAVISFLQKLISLLAILFGEAAQTRALRNEKQAKMLELNSKIEKLEKENIPPAEKSKQAEKKTKKTRSQKRS